MMAEAKMYKRSQRPTWSCTECARRKIKCDKKIPCQPCIKRNAVHLCSLDHEHTSLGQTQMSSKSSSMGVNLQEKTEPNSYVTNVIPQSTSYPNGMVSNPNNSFAPANMDLHTQVHFLTNTVNDLERRLRFVERTRRPSGVGKSSPATSTYDHANDASPISASSSRIPHGSPTRRLAQKSSSSEGVADTALTFEYLALGRDRHLGILQHEQQNSQHQHHNHQRLQRTQPYQQLQMTHANRPGMVPSVTTSNILSEPLQEIISDRVQSALLPSRALEYVLTFAKDVIAWQHACIHIPTFQRECDAFLSLQEEERWTWTNPLWLALFFVVQSIAVHQMSANDVENIIGPSERPFPEILLNAAVKCLGIGRYLSEPSLFTCQALTILCVTGHNVADSNLLSTYLAVGIKTAQMLNLHHLANESALVEARLQAEGGEVKDDSPEWTSKIIRLEVGKRIWWSLVQQEYLALPFCGTSMVNPRHHDTPFPANVHDDDLDRGHLRLQYDESDLTYVQKLRVTAKMAQIVYTFFDQLPNRQTSGARLEDHVQPYESQLLQLLPLSQPRSTNPALKFGLALKRYINIGVSHKILVLHRAFCSLKPPPSSAQIQLSQTRCLEAARQVLEHVRSIKPSGRPEGQVGAMWTISYQAVAAAMVIILNHFRTSHGTNQNKDGNGMLTQTQNSPNSSGSVVVTRQEVMDARQILHGLAYRSMIAQRGVQLMDDVIQGFEEAERHSTAQKRSGDYQNTGEPTSPSKRLRNEENVSFTTLQSPSNSFTFVNGVSGNGNETNTINSNLADFDIGWDVASALQSMPDVSKLFDGSIGNPFGSF